MALKNCSGKTLQKIYHPLFKQELALVSDDSVDTLLVKELVKVGYFNELVRVTSAKLKEHPKIYTGVSGDTAVTTQYSGKYNDDEFGLRLREEIFELSQRYSAGISAGPFEVSVIRGLLGKPDEHSEIMISSGAGEVTLDRAKTIYGALTEARKNLNQKSLDQVLEDIKHNWSQLNTALSLSRKLFAP